MVRKTILCVGRIYADLIFRSDQLPQWGREVFCEGFQYSAGGGAFISGAYLRALGHHVLIAGVAGAVQPFGDIIARDLREFDLDGSNLQYGRSPQITVALAGAQDRAFLTHRTDLAVTPPQVAAFDHLHIGELETLIECPELINLARSAGATISADCGDQAQFDAATEDLLAELDVFMPSASEFAALKRAGVSLDRVPLLVEKQGAQGAAVHLRGGSAAVHMPAFSCQVVDTTGAGDAFNAGFLDVWLQGGDLREALTKGGELGACAISHLGGAAGAKKLAD